MSAPGRPNGESWRAQAEGAPLSAPAELPTRRRAPWWQTARAVAWSFFGVRRSADHARDVQRLNPVHVIVAGLAGAALFVAALVLLVRWVVGSGVAG